jgi:O-antigen/teichoic acid export membrane protein
MAQGRPRQGFARLTRDSLVYSLGSVAGKAIGVIMLPILTRLLTVAEFGRLDLLSTLLSALISALLLGLDTSALRLYFDVPAEGERRRLVSTWVVLGTAINLVAAVVVVLCRTSISQALFGTADYGLAVALVGVAVVLGTWEWMCLTSMRMQKRPAPYALVEGVNLAVTAAATVVLLLAGHRTAAACMVGTSIGYLAAVVVCPGLVKMVTGRPSKPFGKRLLRLGLPLVPGVVATWGAEFANRAILARMAGIDQVAFFSVSVRMGSAGVLVASSFQLAWLPEAYERGEEHEAHVRTATEARRIVAAVCMLTAALALVSRELLLILGGRSYLAGLGAVGYSELLGVALALLLVAGMPSALTRKFGDVGLATTVGTGVGVVANLLLASRFGATGTAAAVTFGVLVGAVVLAVIGRHRFELAVPWLWIIANVVVTAVVVLVSCLPRDGASIPVRIGLAVVAGVVFWLEGTPQEALRWFGARRRRQAADT